jgi:valyl-tRNA synthetase
VSNALDTFAMGTAANAVHDFGWYKLCDWYLEATKIEAQTDTRAAVLSFALNTLMRLLHPIEPFVTEEIWQHLPHDGQTIVTASWPDVAEIPAFPNEADVFDTFIASVVRVRNAKAEFDLKPADRIDLRTSETLSAEFVQLYAALVRGNVVRATSGEPGEPTQAAASAQLKAALATIEVVADTGALRERYTREIAKLEEEVARLERKLGNAQFVEKAKPDVVASEREKLASYAAGLSRARAALGALPSEN